MGAYKVHRTHAERTGLSGLRRTMTRTDWTNWTYSDVLVQAYRAYPLPLAGSVGSNPNPGTGDTGYRFFAATPPRLLQHIGAQSVPDRASHTATSVAGNERSEPDFSCAVLLKTARLATGPRHATNPANASARRVSVSRGRCRRLGGWTSRLSPLPALQPRTESHGVQGRCHHAIGVRRTSFATSRVALRVHRRFCCP